MRSLATVRHLLSALDEFEARNVAFLSMTENIDTSSALGKAVFIIVAAVGALERDLIRERVQAGVDRARKRCSTWGRPQRWTESDARRAIELRQQRKSWRQVAMSLKLPVRTIRRAVATVAKGVAPGEGFDT